MKPDSLSTHGTGFCLSISWLIAAFWLAWQALVPVNFAYPLAYDTLHIQQHIDHYGPENRYKHGFSHTTPKERQRLFAAIVQAIQHHGDGLRRITYSTPDGIKDTLLREPEVVHLQDVANLIDLFDVAAWISLGITAVALAFLAWRRLPPPGLKQIVLGLGGLLLASGAILLIMGPTRTFYWLHTHIFPANHEWFFYYQDSLMTTLMKAPDLFGFIAAIWVVLALILFGAGIWGFHAGLRRLQQVPVAPGHHQT